MLAFKKAKRVARPQPDHAQSELAAFVTYKPSAPAQALVRPQRKAAADPHAIRLGERSFARALRAQAHRQLLPDFDPGQRQQAWVGERRLQLNLVAAEGARTG